MIIEAPSHVRLWKNQKKWQIVLFTDSLCDSVNKLSDVGCCFRVPIPLRVGASSMQLWECRIYMYYVASANISAFCNFKAVYGWIETKQNQNHLWLKSPLQNVITYLDGFNRAFEAVCVLFKTFRKWLLSICIASSLVVTISFLRCFTNSREFISYLYGAHFILKLRNGLACRAKALILWLLVRRLIKFWLMTKSLYW